MMPPTPSCTAVVISVTSVSSTGTTTNCSAFMVRFHDAMADALVHAVVLVDVEGRGAVVVVVVRAGAAAALCLSSFAGLLHAARRRRHAKRESAAR